MHLDWKTRISTLKYKTIMDINLEIFNVIT